MTDFVYRYRSTDKLLGRDELSKCQFFFPTIDKLNDPLEGYKDVFWRGDEIVWKRLFEHFVYIYMQMSLEHIAQWDGPKVHDLTTLIHTTPLDFRDEEYKQLFVELRDSFLAEDVVKTLYKLLHTKKIQVRREKLIHFLHLMMSILNFHFFTHLKDGDYLRRFLNRQANLDPAALSAAAENARQTLSTLLPQNYWINAPDKALAIAANMFMQISVKRLIDLDQQNRIVKWQDYLTKLPGEYVKALENVMYVNWHTVCFSADPTNSSMWGMYADSHKGVCLKFKTESATEHSIGLQLNRVRLWPATAGSMTPHKNFGFQPFYKVNYKSKPPTLNFFTSIGRSNMQSLAEFWYLGDDGKISTTGMPVLSEDENWRNAYWNTFIKSVTRKTADWRHEKEYRIVVYSMLEPDMTDERRTIHFEFKDLVGIVFGLNTEPEKKAEIVKIVYQKCAETGRKDFEFQQSVYNPRNGKIELMPMSFLSLPKPS